MLEAPVERAWLDLTLAQRAVWLDAQLATEPSAYTLVRFARIRGELDPAAARRALTLVTARHEALRLRVDPDQPRQWLHPSPEIDVAFTDVAGSADPEAALQGYVAGALSRAMPLGETPLFELHLVRTGAASHAALLRCHHLLADEAAVTMVLRHWFDAYVALTSDSPPELGAPTSYLPEIEADLAYQRSERYAADLAYWKGRFATLPAPLVDARPPENVAPGAPVNAATWLFAADPYARFAAACSRAGVAPQRAVFALLGAALGRRYGRSDVVLGMALHRRGAGNARVIGMLAGTIAVRLRLPGEASVAEIVREASAQIDDDLRRQRFPIDALARALELSAVGLGGLFQVAVSFVPLSRLGGAPGDADGAGDLTFSLESLPTREASPLTVHAYEREDGLAIDFAALPEVLDGPEVERLLELFRIAVARFTEDAESEVATLPRTTPDEAACIAAWRGAAVEFPSGPADAFVAERARLDPGTCAVTDGREALTYGELDVRANAFAERLVAAGVPAGAAVGVALERSIGTVVALLGILKAGCVYLPLDVAYPAERLAFMLDDSGAAALVTSAAFAERLPASSVRTRIEPPAASGEARARPPERPHGPADTAYIIYTSGSTGRPKGVAVPHRAAVNLAFARLAHDPIGPGDRILAAISVGFDVSIGQLLLPLLHGATVVIAGDLRALSASDFWAFLAAQGVTHVNSVPSFIDSVLGEGAPAGLVRLMLGGEPLAPALVARLRRALPRTQVVNMYGPTEACIDATCYPAAGDETSHPLPIGKPLPNYRAYVLDERLEPVGIGVPGELALAGPGLAHGYRGDAARTAERFTADPFGAPGDRLYRTGDRARWNPAGELEFLGRADAQVKIRGHRVELGEIEAELRALPGVATAAVIASGDRSGGAARLVAYVVADGSRPHVEAPGLRTALAARLPDYMVPAAFHFLSALPLTANGKLDERALPAVDWNAGRVHVAPVTERERELAALFAELLDVPEVGASDNFFELGGHSLLATRLVSQLRARTGVNLKLRAVFEHPTVAGLARAVDAAAAGALDDDGLAPAREGAHGPPPLSFAQKRLWFLSQLGADDTYNVPFAVRVRGEFSVARAVDALERIVARHEPLRTCIVLRDGHPAADVREPAEFSVAAIDLSTLDGASRERALDERLRAFARAPFDLARELPIRAAVVTLGPREFALAVVAHHAAFDGWSAGIFLAEFAALYGAPDRERAHALAPLPARYGEFAAWQRERDLAAALDYWRRRFDAPPERLDFPADRAASRAGRRPAGRVRVELDAALHAALAAVASTNGASLFMVLHAAYAVVLARWTARHDVVIGTVVANRLRAEFEPLVGCFVNTLALRTALAPGASFAAVLRAIRDDDLAAFEHQELPFERLVDALQPERSLAHAPLFDAMLVLQDAPPSLALGALEVEPIALEPGAAKFELTLDLAASRGGAIRGALEYAADAFDEATIARFGAQLERFLRTVASDPETLAFAVDLLEPSERHDVLAGRNATAVPYAIERAERAFARQVRRTPHAIAVIGADGDASSTYAELRARSFALARRLRARGVVRGTVVGVALERSLETVVALLAILEAGGTYLPLDPAYPRERIAFMLADSRASLAISDSAHADLLPPNFSTLMIDDLADAYDPREEDRAIEDVESAFDDVGDARDVAYIIYTSGSTGEPKGVAVSHAAAVNLAFARQPHDPIGPGDRVLAAISVGFDVSIGQLVLPLLSGATVVIAGDVRTQTPREFWAFLEAQRITHVNSVPSFFDSILAAAPARSSLVRVMLGGEALSSALVRRLRHALPATGIVNMYGPTEACIDATCYVTDGTETAAFVPIGKPLPNYRAYVLDARLEPVGIGIAGDLYLSGAGLAYGYVGSAALTASRFIADPFGAPGERLYKTGDRARWNADGTLLFLGRADSQIKLRGHRIELGEIDARLASQPGIREAVTIVREDEPGDPRLVAYYTASDIDGATAHAAPDAEALRAALLAVLPGYMVPAAFVRLDAVPLTTNGKLDRSALPAPGVAAYPVRIFEPPENLAERLVAAAFANVLPGIASPGRSDNFFELGGHSLLAMTLIERLRESGLHVDVRDLFAAPTVAGVAAASRDATARIDVPPNAIPDGATALTPEMLPLIALSQDEIDRIVAHFPGGAANVCDVYPLAPLQEGMLFHHVMAERGDAYVTPFVLAFATRERLETFAAALDAVIARHDILRTAVAFEGLAVPVQVVARAAPLVLEEVDLGDAPAGGAERALRARFDPRVARIDVTRPPLMRAFVARDAAEDRWLLLLASHHLILDHTSLELVLHEIALISAGRGRELAEPEPFRTFVAHARLGVPPDEHERFFRDLLGDVDEPTAPFGLGAVRDAEGETREATIALASGVGRRIRERARALGVGPAALFHQAWALVVAHASGRDDVVFGTLVFGRMHGGGGARPALGLFVNTLPLRLRLDRSESAESALRATHRQLADLLRHEHASLALAQRCSGVPAPAPLFTSLFNYRQSPAGDSAPGAWAGGDVIFAQERTDYPLAVAVDDRASDFLITAQVTAPLDPGDVCAYLETAVTGLLEALERSPAAALGAVDVLPPGVAERVTTGWNATAVPYAIERAERAFARQVRRTPHAIAVIGADGDASSTYAELRARSFALARRLRARGVVRGTVVGVALERSLETVVALLAILEAGGTYLPLDPAYPRERIAFMLADSRASLAISDSAHADLLPPNFSTLMIDALDNAQDAREEDRAIEDAESAFDDVGDARDVAYIIYTSGSTGEPKGVAVSHAAAVNLAFARQPHDPIGPGDRVLAAISVGFDVSIGQLVLPLLSGATVVIAGDVRTQTPREFWAFLEAQRVTHVNSVPSFFDSILAAAPVRSSLVRVMLGGEALSSTLVRRLRRALPGTGIVNMYGPTEACIDATCYVTDGMETGSFVPIGKPLPNYRAYVLDARLEPVGVGIAGDLYLGGAGLAYGYVGSAALTASRFIADPFGAPGERLYKTGDRARWNADGTLLFLGRADSQIKLRGHRIELGEIDARLASQPGVREAVTIVREDEPGDPRLVAYYTASEVANERLLPETLRSALGAALPGYMIPAAFVRLDAVPLTTNGKLDRGALPVPAAAAFAKRPFEEPHGEIEGAIAAIFAEVVRSERVGRHDNFFELGGHSLLAMALIERLRARGLEVDVRDLFAAPTVAGVAAAARGASARVEIPPNAIPDGATAIAPEMLPLIALSQDEIDLIVARVPGGAANVRDLYPLAPLQEGMLFRHLLTERGDPYLAPFLLGFERREALDAFLDALRVMVARHDALRTMIVWEGVREPVQVVLREATLPVEERPPARGATSAEPSREPDAARALFERYASETFRLDVGRAPLLRAIVQRDPARDRWLLLIVSHHLILDHTSLEVLLQEVALVATGRAAELAPPAPYRDFIASARAARPEEHEAYFRALLGDVAEPTLPYGLAHVRGEGGGIREAALALERDLSERVRERARALGVGPATLLHVAWALVLAHVSGRDDVVFGTLLFGRMQGGGARTLGMLINTLPARVRIDGRDAAAAARDMHAQLAELMRHEHASLALAGRCSAVPAPAPLFSALFNFRQSAPAGAASSAAWPGVELLLARERTDYPVSLAVDDRGADFLITALTDDPIDPGDVCAMMETSLRNLLAALERERPPSLREIEVLPATLRARVVEHANATPAAIEPGTLGERFDAQAARTPHAEALVDDGVSLGYVELRARADAFAGVMAARGAGLGTVIGVALPRSAQTVIALLAIVKLGAVYLPLDVAHPPERLAHALADAGAAFVVANETSRALLPAGVERLDPPADRTQTAAPFSPPARLTPEHTAYIIYTSGSTGAPKGVAVPHRAAVNLAIARLRHDPIGPGDRVLAAISVGFDVSIGQLLLPLLSGATVVIARDVKTLAAHEFWEFLATHRVTHVNSVPSFFESIVAVAPPQATLVRLMLGGEALSTAFAARLQRVLPATEIVNMYGPTEACIDATCRPVTGGEPPASAVVPIGRPLPGYRAYVLDARLEPVAPGVAGDLYLAGTGLAHGYVGAPALTASRFLPDPFGGPGERLYATGDRARRNAGGELEFLGRSDAQLKVRGHRVEPGEIEAALRAHPAVSAAAVVVRARAGTARLEAFVVPRPGEAAPDAAALRAHLAARLPDYMLPGAIAPIERLPLTANGKLDAAALPAIGAGPAARGPYEPPRTETERALAPIWAELLGVDLPSRHDDFFELGGHSLAAIRLLAACNARFERKLPLRVLFERPTLAALATAIDAGDAALRDDALVPLRSSGSRRPLFCIHPAGGHVFCYLPLVRALSPDQPVYGLQARALEPGVALAGSIESLAEEYVADVRRQQPRGPYRLLGMSSGGLVAFEIARRLRDAGEEVELLALLDTSLPGTNVSFDETMLVRGVAAEFGLADLLDEVVEPATIARLFARARDLGRLPEQLDVAFAERVAAVYRNAVRICDAYRPAVWDGPFLLVRALRREREGEAAPDWSALISGRMTSVDLDCTHADVMSAPLAPALARQLEEFLRRTDDGID